MVPAMAIIWTCLADSSRLRPVMVGGKLALWDNLTKIMFLFGWPCTCAELVYSKDCTSMVVNR